MVGVGHHGGGNSLLDDRLSLDGHGDRGVVGGINVDGDGDLDDVVSVEGGVIGDVDLALDKDGGLDIVDLNLLVDDGGIHGLGSLEDGGELGGGGLEDPGVVSGDIAGLSIVDLLGDNGGRLVDRGGAWALGHGGVGGGGSGLGVGSGDGLNRSVGDKSVASRGRASAVGDSSVHSACISSGGKAGHQGGAGGSTHAAEDEGKCHERSHLAATYLPLSL